MSYKAALADLPFGGGKAVIIGDSETGKTESLMLAFGRFVQSLGGVYHTAVEPGAIYGVDADVFAPCALGAVINDEAIGLLKAGVAGEATSVIADRIAEERLAPQGDSADLAA